MSISGRFIDQHLPHFSKNWGLFFLWGIVLMLTGVCAISAVAFTTLVSIVVLGFVIFFSGCVVLIDSITFWRGKQHGFVLHFLGALLYIGAGVLLMSNPVAGSVTITFMLGFLYAFLGIIRIAATASTRLPNWGWGFFNGLISLLIGVLIIMSWPDSSVFVIGLFIGIDLFFLGLAYSMAALAAKRS